ncbi:hypothetical protein ACLKA6_010479 [Drosophila palustris]
MPSPVHHAWEHQSPIRGPSYRHTDSLPTDLTWRPDLRGVEGTLGRRDIVIRSSGPRKVSSASLSHSGRFWLLFPDRESPGGRSEAVTLTQPPHGSSEPSTTFAVLRRTSAGHLYGAYRPFRQRKQSCSACKITTSRAATRAASQCIHFDGQSDPLSFIENLLPEYQLYIRRHSLAQLTQLATDKADGDDGVLWLGFGKQTAVLHAPGPGEGGHQPVLAKDPIMRVEKARIVAQDQIEGQVRQATIDTGATRSFISEAAASQLGYRQLRDVRAKVSMADGSRATVSKALIATVQLGEKCACIPFLVLSTVVDDTPTERRNTIRATTASQDPLPGCETTLGGTIEAYITHTQTASDAIPKTTARTPRKKAKEGQERCQQCSWGPLVDGEPSLRPLPFGGTTAGPGDLSAPAQTHHEARTTAGPGDLSAPRNVYEARTTVGPGDLSAPAQTHHEARTTAGPGDLSAPRNVYEDIPFGDPKAGTTRNPFGETTAEVCAIAIPPEPDPHVNEADDDAPARQNQLNANSIPDAYPLPRIHHILERLRNAKYISTLDLKSGYWQIPMARGSREYTASDAVRPTLSACH